MISIRLGHRDLARLRFAFSPLWETVAAFRIWRNPGRHVLHGSWVAEVDATVRGVDWVLLDAVARAPGGYLPDFLAPPPETPDGGFASELATLRRTPARVVRREVAATFPRGAPAVVRSGLGDTRRLLDGLARLLEEFWRRAIAPEWPAIKSRLEAEVIFRSRMLALGGAPAVFSALHPTVRYRDTGTGGSLEVDARDRFRREAGGAGLLLVPSAFAWPDVWAVARPPWRPTLAYPARGVGDLWSEAPDSSCDDAMAALLGERRAMLLRTLSTPHTTSEIGRRLRMSPAAASAQATTLWRAGVADRIRVGRRVYYVLNPKGLALVDGLAIK